MYMKSRDNTMRKNNFINGAVVTTIGIVIAKVLGILYVIFFHEIVQDEGGTLYGYAYTIYMLFMSLSSAGIPLAISRIVCEYQTLGYYNTKKRTFDIGKKLAIGLGVCCFVILFFAAPLIAKAILGNLSGGSKIEDITLVLRVVSLAILVVPILSIYRGYFEGHRFMEPPSISQVIEQLVRVLIIIIGSFLAVKVFKLSVVSGVVVALIGTSVGAIAAYLYLVIKKNNNKQKFNERIRQVNEPIISTGQIVKKIVIYSIPFIMVDLFKSLYNYVDMVTVVKGLVKYAHFKVLDAEIIMSMLSTWGNKFNMIILSVSTGVIVSLIPNLTQSVVSNNRADINKKINQALNILLFLMIPMSIGISFLAKPIWALFYGESLYGSSLLTYYIFCGLIIGLSTAIVTIIQVLRDYKWLFISLLVGVILKVMLNTNLIDAFYKMGLPAYYGVITASIIGYLTSLIIALLVLHFEYGVNYEEFFKNLLDIICASVVMTGILLVCRLVVPIVSSNRIINLFIILFYSLVGLVTYFIYSYKSSLVKRVFGNKLKKFGLKK